MLKTLFKSSVFVLLLTFFCAQSVYAGTKVYQYDGKLPFVEMMLNMMVAMGILDRLPSNSRYGGYGGYGRNAYNPSALSGYSNTYLRALELRGLSPGSSLRGRNNYLGRNNLYGNNPFMRSPWIQSPWTRSSRNTYGVDGVSPLWGSPSWGVLPSYGYSSNYYSPYGRSLGLSGWADEPWESSTWNPRAEMSRAEIAQQREKPAASNAPIVQNFNYSSPDGAHHNSRQENASSGSGRKYRSSPLAKLAPSGPAPRSQMKPQYRPSDGDYTAQSKKRSPLWKRTNQETKSKPCVTEFCGLKIPDINGIWVSQSGELLGIKGQRFFWSDGESRHLKGTMKIQNEYLMAYVTDYEKLMRYKYKLAGNQLLTMTRDGVIREFVRIPDNQLYERYLGYY
jgi:hypothetical protein